MAADDLSPADQRGNPPERHTVPGVRATAVFSDPPGIPTGLAVTVEHGDVVLLVELAGVPFCQIVLAPGDALDLNIKLAALLAGRRQGGER